MNWLALSPAEIAVVWAALAAVALWLYLHHRRPQHKKVSTLRFWASVAPVSQPRRRKLREPWALLRLVKITKAVETRRPSAMTLSMCCFMEFSFSDSLSKRRRLP